MNNPEVLKWIGHHVLLETRSGHVFASARLFEGWYDDVRLGVRLLLEVPDDLFQSTDREGAFLPLTDALVEKMEVKGGKPHLRLDADITVRLPDGVKLVRLLKEAPTAAKPEATAAKVVVGQESITKEPPPKHDPERYGDLR